MIAFACQYVSIAHQQELQHTRCACTLSMRMTYALFLFHSLFPAEQFHDLLRQRGQRRIPRSHEKNAVS